MRYLFFAFKTQELNTAEDFISLYEEIIPYTQTLPLVLLHKESLISKLLSRLHMKARLSLEPILRFASIVEDCFFFCIVRDARVLCDEIVTINSILILLKKHGYGSS